MRVLAEFWWVIPMVLALPYFVKQWIRIAGVYGRAMVALFGLMLLAFPITWLFTGNVNTENMRINLSPASAAITAVFGATLLLAAARMSPPRAGKQTSARH